MIGLGCMRLSTLTARNDTASAEVLAAALAAGVDLFDTADVYGLDDSEIGHNERLLAEIAGRATVVTKGGLTRPGGAWVPDGRARHLVAAARASRDRLGVAELDLYLLHAVDPKTPLATSARALARIREDGIARAVGLSNVNLTQLEHALEIVEIAAVEVELHPWKLDALRGGVIAACAERGIRVLAHRPLGGPDGVARASRDPVLGAIGRRHVVDDVAATPHEVVLAWIRTLALDIVPLPGATRVVTAVSAARGQRLELAAEARATLAEHFVALAPHRRHTPRTMTRIDITPPEVARVTPPGIHPLYPPAPPSAAVSVSSTETNDAAAEVVILLGMPASGKSTIAAQYVDRGYLRFNRDECGGSLLDVARAVHAALVQGTTRIVVDNTYPSRASRAPLLELARSCGAAVRCVVVATPLEDAQAFAAARILARTGGFEHPREIRPTVQFRWQREFEPPRLDEGFIAIDEIVPVRRTRGAHAGLIVELDGIVWTGKPALPEKIALVDGARAGLAAWSEHVVAATVWRPGIERAVIDALAARLSELVGRMIDLRHCPHLPGPPVCWCRKPLPGLAMALVRDHALDVERTIHLGKAPTDAGFARRAGVRYASIDDGWPVP